MSKKRIIITIFCIITILVVALFVSNIGNNKNEIPTINTGDVTVNKGDEQKLITKSDEKKTNEARKEEKQTNDTVKPEQKTDEDEMQDSRDETENVKKGEKLPENTQPEAEKYEEKKEEEKEFLCTLTVMCDASLAYSDKLSEGKRAIIPPDGIFVSKKDIEFNEGESAFDILERELKKSGIHMEFVKNPLYNSVYIEGIGNLYEFDAGELSGWLYKVNGIKPNFGSSEYMVKNKDKIEFIYSCNYMEEQ